MKNITLELSDSEARILREILDLTGFPLSELPSESSRDSIEAIASRILDTNAGANVSNIWRRLNRRIGD